VRRKGGPSLAELLAALSKIEGLHWIRILYAYPSYFSEELIDEIARNNKVCKYIDIPLQHISNLTLLAMNRPPRAFTEGLLRKLRERIPGLILRTTFICGFPGESEEQHQELVDFCKTFQFDRMGAFAFSQEEGTAAFALPDQVGALVISAWPDAMVFVAVKSHRRFMCTMSWIGAQLVVFQFQAKRFCMPFKVALLVTHQAIASWTRHDCYRFMHPLMHVGL
jgi:ribosomal protein S12 methylthiotransferase